MRVKVPHASSATPSAEGAEDKAPCASPPGVPTTRFVSQEPARPQDAVAVARRRGRRAVLATFLFFTVAFIAISATEIISTALGSPVTPIAAITGKDDTSADPVKSRECADGVHSLASAVDLAAAAALASPDEKTATTRFRESLAGVWDPNEKPTEASCNSVPRGRDAFAAVLRLREAQEGFIRRQVVEIAPLRRDVSAYLPR